MSVFLDNPIHLTAFVLSMVFHACFFAIMAWMFVKGRRG